MKRLVQPVRRAVLICLAVVVGGGLAAYAVAAPPNHANRLEATFTEAAVSVTDRTADLGIFQVILTGSGTVEGFGPATEVTGVTQDRAVTPCGASSDSEAATRRILIGGDTLALRSVGVKCPTPSGPVFTATYEVDGLSSTGIFAGASGSGTDTVDIINHRVTLSGTLKLASDNS
jgi:hypothetical protein